RKKGKANRKKKIENPKIDQKNKITPPVASKNKNCLRVRGPMILSSTSVNCGTANCINAIRIYEFHPNDPNICEFRKLLFLLRLYTANIIPQSINNYKRKVLVITLLASS